MRVGVNPDVWFFHDGDTIVASIRAEDFKRAVLTVNREDCEDCGRRGARKDWANQQRTVLTP